YELDYTYDDSVGKKPSVTKFPHGAFNNMIRGAAASQSNLSWRNVNKSPLNAPVKTKVADQAYTVASSSNLKEFDQSLRAGSYAEVLQSLNNIIKTKPAMADDLQIVGVHELA
ncbi:MAG TPA: hypothetical protein VFF23_01260, partial [Hanamia sp.]|nr:hypothetical protein [Hanamia sp.]